MPDDEVEIVHVEGRTRARLLLHVKLDDGVQVKRNRLAGFLAQLIGQAPALFPARVAASQDLLGDQPRHSCQDWLQPPDHRLEQADPGTQPAVDVRLDRVRVVQIDNLYGFVSLPEAIDTADPLLDQHRIPGHVVVHESPAELEIEALGRRVGVEQQVGLPLDGTAASPHRGRSGATARRHLAPRRRDRRST